MRPILVHPDPRLRRRAAPSEGWREADLRRLADEMRAAMHAGPGGVGLAAPQLGEDVRLILVDAGRARRPCRHHGELVMRDPRIVRAEGRVFGREGCLSVPDWVGLVPRAARIVVAFTDLAGRLRQIEAKGFEARVIQHEIDHLDGILFLDRVVSTRDLVRRGQPDGVRGGTPRDGAGACGVAERPG